MNRQHLRTAAAFLAASAVLLCAAVFTVKPPSPSEEGGSLQGDGSGSFTHHFGESVHSFAICQQAYQNGHGISPLSAIVLDDMMEFGGVTARKGAFSLAMSSSQPDAELTIRTSDGTVATLGGLLPADSTGELTCLWRDGEVELPEEGSVILGVVSTGDAPELYTLEQQGVLQTLEAQHANAVVFRLAVSTQGMDTLDDLAQQLLAFAPVRQQDSSTIRAIASALGMNDAGTYFIVTYEQAVEFAFNEPLSDEQEIALWAPTQVMLALISDADQVNISYPTKEGNQQTVSYDAGALRAWAVRKGYADEKELGASVQGIRELLTDLGF